MNADRPVWWYLPVVFSDSFPWSLFLFPAAALWFRERAPGARAGDVGFRIRTLLWIWILVIVGFFSLSAGKQDLYIFPIVPAVVALAGVVIARALDRRGAGRAADLTLVTAVIGGLLVVRRRGFLALFNSALAVYALAGSALVGVDRRSPAAPRRCCSRGAGASAPRSWPSPCALIVVNWMFVLRVLPSFEAYKPAPGLAAVLEERAGPSDVIVTYNVALPSLVYYLRRHIDVFYDHGPVLELLHSRPPALF